MPDDDDAPKGLPPVQHRAPSKVPARVDRCPKCEKKLRIVSNYLGVNSHCDSCKEVYPVSSTPRRVEPVLNLPRGLRKRTLVEPDWNKAFEDIGESGDPNKG